MESWKMTFLPGRNWTIDCVRFGGDWANSIFYLILLYFNHIAKNVRIVQNEKLHKLIFHYEVSLYRSVEGTSLTLICCSDQWWISSNRLKPVCEGLPHHAKPEGHSSILLWLELVMLSAVLRRDSNLEVSGCSTTHHGSGLLTHQAVMAKHILPCGLNCTLRYSFFLPPPPHPSSCSSR